MPTYGLHANILVKRWSGKPEKNILPLPPA